jgi:hypothetical protein
MSQSQLIPLIAQYGAVNKNSSNTKIDLLYTVAMMTYTITAAIIVPTTLEVI